MPTVLHTPDEETMERVIADRKERGLDRFDEVWEGEYVLMNAPSNKHQLLVGRLTAALTVLIDRDGHDFILPGANVSDRIDWRINHRIPDVLVYLAGNPAENRGSFFLGGPDLAIEIVSPGDRTYQKFDFYAAVGVRELVVVDEPLDRFTLHRLSDGKLTEAGVAALGTDGFATETASLTWTLAEADGRLRLRLQCDAGTQDVWIG